VKRARDPARAKQAALRAEQRADDLACEEQALEAQNAN
jgi:hypothetical protein